MRVLYGMEAVRYIVAWPVCAALGHRWGSAGPIRCERCGYVDEEKLRAFMYALAPVTRAFRRMSKTTAEVGAAFARLKRAMDKVEAGR